MSALRAAVAVLALAAGALLAGCDDDDEPVLDLDRPADVGTGAPSQVP